MNETLVIPDCHVLPGQTLSRFDPLGELIVQRRPDHIVFLGDFVTLESLSHWDADKPLLMENRRYLNDIRAGREALQRTLAPLRALQDKQRRLKEKLYRPLLVWCHGNHEHRLYRYLEKYPALVGQLDLTKDLGLEEFGFHSVVPYKDYINLDGVLFTHAVINAAGQPTQGKYAVFRAGEICHNSVVFAHLHRKESVNFRRHGRDELIQCLSAGCFFEDTPDYARGGISATWSGVLLISHIDFGMFDVEEYSLERLRYEFSG